MRIDGAVEVHNPRALRRCETTLLRDLATGAAYPAYQNLDPGAGACHLDARGVIDACVSLCRQIRAGCYLVVLSKFGRLETARTGLVAAFAAAAEMDTPILTAVAPPVADAWQAFAGSLAEYAAPDLGSLDRWWRTISAGLLVTAR